MLNLIDLRRDGTWAQSTTDRGKPANVTGTFAWTCDGPQRLIVTHRLAEPIRPPLEGSPVIGIHIHQYNLQRLDGLAMELLETRSNAVLRIAPEPVWWRM